MKKYIAAFVASVACLAMSGAVGESVDAGADVAPSYVMEKMEPAGGAMRVPARVDADYVASLHWGAWEELGKASFTNLNHELWAQTFAAHGEEWVVFKEPFVVSRRTNSTDPDFVQYQFVNIFNHADIILTQDLTDGMIATHPVQDMGIKISDSTKEEFGDTYENYMFSTMYSIYNEATGTFMLNNCRFFINEQWYFSAGRLFVQLEGKRSASISLTYDSLFVPAGKNATINVDFDETLASGYRVAIYESGVPFVDIAELQNANPALPHTDYTGKVPFIVGAEGCTSRNIIVFPINSEGYVVGQYLNIGLYFNLASPYEWENVGKGTLTDMVGHGALTDPYDSVNRTLLLPAAKRTVAVQRRKDNPNIYRVCNIFAGDYPYKDRFAGLLDDPYGFWVEFDVSDSLHVKMPRTLSGVCDAYGIPVLLMPSTTYTPDTPDYYYGSLIDNKLDFNKFTVSMGYSRMPESTVRGDFSLELPDRVSYDLTLDADGAPDASRRVGLSGFSDNVARVKIGLLNGVGTVRDAMEEIVNGGVIGNIVTLYDITPSASHRVKLSDMAIYNGEYHLVAVPYDAANNPHSPVIGEAVIRYLGDIDTWEYLGDATVKEKVLLHYFGVPCEYGFNVPAYFDPDNSSIVALAMPGEYLYRYLLNSESGMSDYYFFDAPQHMYVKIDGSKAYFVANGRGENFPTEFQINTNFYVNGESHWWMSYASYYMTNGLTPDDSYFGTYDAAGSVISFIGGNQIILNVNGRGYGQWDEASLIIDLPSDPTGVDEITVDNTGGSAAEYYNLQGVRIAAPAQGFYIERRGGNVAKKFAK